MIEADKDLNVTNVSLIDFGLSRKNQIEIYEKGAILLRSPEQNLTGPKDKSDIY